MPKPSVAFLCVHNSCRSQMAEALAKHYGADVLKAMSAGSERAPRINPDAVRLMKEIYGIDMEKTQRSKTVFEIPEKVDIAIKMGCEVQCPALLKSYEEDWGLEDPTGKPDGEFKKTIAIIDEKVQKLIADIKAGKYPLK